MKPSLRELFLAPDALDPGNNPLVRLGALHHLHRTGERGQVRQRLEELLRDQDIQALQSAAPNVSIFPLHVAVALAQEGSNEGIQWLLRYLNGANQEHQRLAFTALRNCRQFPLAVLLSSAIAGDALEASYNLLGDLSTFSDDQAWMLAEKVDRTEPIAMISALESAIAQVQRTVRPDRRLALGTVITRPLRNPIIGLRYTGFLVVEESLQTLRAVPYQMADLINRDDGAARITASDLLREPGRRVLVAFDAGDHCRAQAVYALPFAALQDTDNLMARLAFACEGLSVGIVVHKWVSRSGPMCRLVTAIGRTEVGYDHAGRMAVGACSLLHASSTRPFFTRLSLSKGDTEKVLACFIRNTDLERATLLRSWENGYQLGSQTGAVKGPFRDEPPQDPVVLIENKVIKEVDHTFPVKLPPNRWAPEDRSAVLQEFFTNSPGYYAVVIDVLEPPSGAPNALILHPQSGLRELRRANSEIGPGTPVFWEVGKEDKVYTTFLTDQSVQAQCSTCFDTGYRVCATCDGKGRVTCSKCGGSGKSQCDHCGGTGERRSDCRGCGGTGDCGKCGGSATVTLDCTICQGTGRYADSGNPCKRCGGQGTFSGTCRVCTRGPQPRGKCPNCKGSGVYIQVCRSCNATGRWNCGRCRTTGIGPCDTCDGRLISPCGCGGHDGIRLRPVTRGS